jgi:predicted glycosyltransferase
VLTANTGITRRREPGLAIEPNRPDFAGLCARAHVSISQAGYNTVVDLLAARTRAVLVPFAAANETEQTLRAAALERLGLARVVDETALTPAALAAAVDRAAADPRPAPGFRLDGAETAARLIEERARA